MCGRGIGRCNRTQALFTTYSFHVRGYLITSFVYVYCNHASLNLLALLVHMDTGSKRIWWRHAFTMILQDLCERQEKNVVQDHQKALQKMASYKKKKMSATLQGNDGVCNHNWPCTYVCVYVYISAVYDFQLLTRLSCLTVKQLSVFSLHLSLRFRWDCYLRVCNHTLWNDT